MTQGFRFGPGRCCCKRTCEDLSRPICYVDKYATGVENGSNWDDAYTTIQAAINAKGTTQRIHIRGYGSSDTYTEDLSLGSDASITGVLDCWVDGYICGVTGCCVYNITATGASLYSYGKFYFGPTANTLISCVATNITSSSGYVYGFYGGDCTDCIAEDITGGSYCSGFANANCTGCLSSNIEGSIGSYGFWGIVSTDCIAEDITGGSYGIGFHCNENIGCTAKGISGTSSHAYGFFGSPSTDCIAEDITGGSYAWGFRDCSPTINCSCTSPEPSDGCFYT